MTNTMITIVAMLVGAVLLTILILSLSVRTVKTQKGLIVLDRKTGRVKKVKIGPGSVWRTPILEKSIELDLTQESVQLPVAKIITQDLLAIEASLLIVYTRNPNNVKKRELEKLLPNYTELGETIKVKADYIIRKLSLDNNQPKDLVSEAGRSRFERKLWNELQALERKLAFQLDDVQVLVAPNEQILNARLKAEGTKQALGILEGYTGVNSFDLQHLLTAELLSRISSGEIDILAAMSLYQNAQMSSSTQISPGVFLIDAPSHV